MESTCTTFLVISGNEKEMKSVYRKLRVPERKDTSGQGVMLSELAKYFGLNPDTIKCRGLYCETEFCEDGVHLMVESPVAFETELWECICGLYESLKFYYYSEDKETDYYVKNDRKGVFHAEKYVIRQTGKSDKYVVSDGELIEEMCGRLRKNLRTVREVYKAVNENNKNRRARTRVSFHKVQIINS